MRKRGLILLFLSAAMVSSCKGRVFPVSNGDMAAESKPSDASEAAAQAGLVTLRSLVTEQNYAGLGFSSTKQAENAQLTDPIRIYRVGLDAVTGFKEGANVESLLIDGRKSIYPVTANQRVVSSISVTQREDGWRATDFGNAALARALASYRQSKDDFAVWVPAMKIYFTARGSGASLILTPIADDPRFEFKAGQAMPGSRVFAVLQRTARGYNGLPQ
ncbi:MAG TPA: hypothetical protein VGD64_03640 [Acidisarcina sp.]